MILTVLPNLTVFPSLTMVQSVSSLRKKLIFAHEKDVNGRQKCRLDCTSLLDMTEDMSMIPVS